MKMGFSYQLPPKYLIFQQLSDDHAGQDHGRIRFLAGVLSDIFQDLAAILPDLSGDDDLKVFL